MPGIGNKGLKWRVDHYWCKVFYHTDASGHKFVVLPKKVKCARVSVIPMQMLKDHSLFIRKC